MKYVIAVASIASSVGAAAEPVLMLNEPRDVEMAKYSCGRAEEEIKSVKEGYKTLKCSDFEECQRASEINAACKVTGPVREVRGFHSQLLAQFASNPQCAITIMRLSDEKSDKAINNNLEAYKRANWELNLGFTPGATKQGWALWSWQSGHIVGAGPKIIRARLFS